MATFIILVTWDIPKPWTTVHTVPRHSPPGYLYGPSVDQGTYFALTIQFADTGPVCGLSTVSSYWCKGVGLYS